MAAPRGSAIRRAGQVLTGFGALVVLVAVLVGAPIALLAFAGNPLPDHVPTIAEIGATLTSRDDGQLFLRALALLGWFGWATFAFSVLVELSASAVRRPAPRLPGMRRQQRAAAALVGSVALILAASPAASAATTLAAPHPAAAAPALAAPPVVTASALGASAATEPGGPDVYRVAKGDYLGEVAERYLDDFARYRDVAKLNRIADPDRIRPGQLLKLPDGANDDGARRHATGRLVVRATPPGPAPEGSATPGGSGTSGGTVAPPTPAAPHTPPAQPPTAAAHSPATPKPAAPGTSTGPGSGSHADRPTGKAPAMAAGASRATDDHGVNRPLAASAVLAVASIVGAQIGAVLGLRRRPATVRSAAGRALPSGRHRRD